MEVLSFNLKFNLLQLNTPGRFLGSAIGIYSDLLRESECQTLENLNSIWKKFGSTDRHLRDAVDDLWATEEEWDTFLRELDVANQEDNVRLDPRLLQANMSKILSKHNLE